ncbi:oxidoreductase-like domain-containing protein 1 [Arctopsyche grandis]|uniref:oxidoreductase-like domain-containing protein 1 n=1 Tax=Arctopsyche grandis TaxID=121162 RepID=UPI00406DA22D
MSNVCRSCKIHISKTSFWILNRMFSDSTNPPTNKDRDKRPMYTPEEPVSIDNPPTTCCMSGCPNCVYIAWAEALSKEMSKADPIIAKKILENITDPSMKAFLQMELRTLGLL